MRWIATIVAMCVCSCYSPHYEDCLITCMNAAHTCPGGLSCDGVYCRNGTSNDDCPSILSDAGTEVDASLDRDGDGKLNAADNCPDKANPDQYDEDNDSLGDVCDPCPPFPAPEDNHDSDNDGVGDGCDPDPTKPVNHIHVFDGFNTSTIEGGGAAVPVADFSVGAGVTKVVAASSSVAHAMTWPLPPGTTSETVLTHVQLTGFSGSIRPMGIGVVTQWNQTAQTGIGCWVGYETTSNAGNLRLFPYGGMLYGIANDAVAVNSTFSIDETRRADVFSCHEKNAVAIAGPTSDPTANGPNAGLLVRAADASFDWVLIVTSP